MLRADVSCAVSCWPCNWLGSSNECAAFGVVGPVRFACVSGVRVPFCQTLVCGAVMYVCEKGVSAAQNY